jgi:integrase
MAKILTQRGIDAAKPKATKRYGIRDGLVPGLQLIVHPSGQKTYALFTRINGKLINLKIGNAAALTLAQAREEARSKLAQTARGEDPRALKQEAIQSAAETVGVVGRRFIERHLKVHTRTWRATERLLEREVFPRWQGRPIDSISKQDVAALLDSVMDRGSLTQANRVLAWTRRLFNWSIERGLIETSPCDRLKRPAPEVKRDRVLDDRELALIWRATIALDFPYPPLIKLLILTAQRRGEVAEMTWSELDPELTLWTLPAERSKNGTIHQIPIAPAVRAILGGLPRIAGEAGYVFTTTGRTPPSDFSNAKRDLDNAITALNGAPIAPWRLHDLRRTAATAMARLGVQLPTVEKILNHVSGSFGGVQGIYQRHDFAAEKREALTRWADHVLALGQVKPIRRSIACGELAVASGGQA